MTITDPDAGIPADDTAAPIDPAPEVPVNDEAELLAAMDLGVEEATPELEPAPEEAAPEPIPGTPEAVAAEAAAEAAKAAAPDADATAEAASLGLKGRSSERFVAMAGEIKALAPLKAAFDAAGIKDVAELPQLVQRARDGADMVAMVQETGASPEDFGKLLDYQSLITAARSGDRGAAEKAFETIQAEFIAVAKSLGREVPGVHDPLSDHPDLVEQVEGGEMTRKAAIELASARTQQKLLQQHQQQTQQQTQAQQQAQQEQQAAQQQGVASLVQWEQATMAKDPAYASKREALNAEVAKIRQQYPPQQWAAMTEYAYRAIQVQAPPPVPVPRPGPIRPGGPRPTMAPATFDNPLDAMDFGIQQASGG